MNKKMCDIICTYLHHVIAWFQHELLLINLNRKSWKIFLIAWQFTKSIIFIYFAVQNLAIDDVDVRFRPMSIM